VGVAFFKYEVIKLHLTCCGGDFLSILVKRSDNMSWSRHGKEAYKNEERKIWIMLFTEEDTKALGDFIK